VRKMKKLRTRRRGRMMVAGTAAVAFVVAGLGLLVYSLVGGEEAEASPPKDPAAHRSFVGVVKETLDPSPDVPKSKALKLTVPEMKRVENVPVHDAPASDDATLDKGALHVRGTGFPWQEEEANVYIAGHRLGYKNTQSYLLFYDLDELKSGDEIILTDADGTRYTYEVFKKFVVDPDALKVMRPLPDRNIVSLQTCTLPDYARRMVVQAELKSVG
jgi:sortase A